LFREIDTKNSGNLDFHNLKAFFEESKIKPRDTEIISILRIIDINDDGKINENEFNFFIELFSGKEPGTHVLNILKKAHEKESQINYFGEQSRQDAYKYDREKVGYQRSRSRNNIKPGTSARKLGVSGVGNSAREKLGVSRSGVSPSFNGKKIKTEFNFIAGSRVERKNLFTSSVSNRPSLKMSSISIPKSGRGNTSYTKGKYETSTSRSRLPAKDPIKLGKTSYVRKEEYTSTLRSRSPLTGGIKHNSRSNLRDVSLPYLSLSFLSYFLCSVIHKRLQRISKLILKTQKFSSRRTSGLGTGSKSPVHYTSSRLNKDSYVPSSRLKKDSYVPSSNRSPRKYSKDRGSESRLGLTSNFKSSALNKSGLS